MKAFFYSAKTVTCGNGCQYTTCSHRCLAALEKIGGLKNIMVLPGGSHFNSPKSMNLRSGDLVILFAGTSRDLEDLVAIKDVFESYRIVLIVGQETAANDGRCHLLNPRYITTVGQHAAELSAVIGKMIGSSPERLYREAQEHLVVSAEEKRPDVAA